MLSIFFLTTISKLSLYAKIEIEEELQFIIYKKRYVRNTSSEGFRESWWTFNETRGNVYFQAIW